MARKRSFSPQASASTGSAWKSSQSVRRSRSQSRSAPFSSRRRERHSSGRKPPLRCSLLTGRARQRRPQRLPVGEGGIDRDRFERPPLLLGQRAQEALERAPVAALEHLDDAAAVGVADDRHQPLRAAPVRGLVDRKPARERPRAGSELPGGAEPEGALDLVAARLLLARDLELRAARAQPREEAGAEARAHPLPGGQLGMRLAEAAPAAAAAKAALAPDERHPPARKRQVAHPHPWPLLDLDPAATQAAAARDRDQLKLDLELVGSLAHRDHGQSFQAEHSAKLLEHPLFLLAPRFLDHAERREGSGCLSPTPSSPLNQQEPESVTATPGRAS